MIPKVTYDALISTINLTEEQIRNNEIINVPTVFGPDMKGRGDITVTEGFKINPKELQQYKEISFSVDDEEGIDTALSIYLENSVINAVIKAAESINLSNYVEPLAFANIFKAPSLATVGNGLKIVTPRFKVVPHLPIMGIIEVTD